MVFATGDVAAPGIDPIALQQMALESLIQDELEKAVLNAIQDIKKLYPHGVAVNLAFHSDCEKGFNAKAKEVLCSDKSGNNYMGDEDVDDEDNQV